MSYFRKGPRYGKPVTNLSGLGADATPADYCAQRLGPNRTTAQMVDCVNNMGTGTTPGSGGSSSSAASKASGFIGDFFKALTAPPATQPTTTIVVQKAPSSGISPVTLAVAGGGALILIAILASRRD